MAVCSSGSRKTVYLLCAPCPLWGIQQSLKCLWSSYCVSDELPWWLSNKESACQCRRLGWEDPLEEGRAIQSGILAWRIPMDRGAWQATAHGITESDRTSRLNNCVSDIGETDKVSACRLSDHLCVSDPRQSEWGWGCHRPCPFCETGGCSEHSGGF